ncbi:MAG: hypothetical protein WA667_10600 [Candidatus Nitrosopolaris sp.]
MTPNFEVPPTRLIAKRYKIRKFHYNTYEIDHPEIKGQLRLISIPVNIFEVPDDLLPKDAKSEFPIYVISYQSIVGFVNTGERKHPPMPPPPNFDLRNAKKTDITSFMIDQQDEPWNEFILQGDPPIMIRTRTILAKLEWIREYTDLMGDPSLWTNHNTAHSVGFAPVGEGGMP